MFNAKYKINLNKEFFNDKNFSCLGSQLIELLNFINSLLPKHNWYVADLDADNYNKNLETFKSFHLKKIGSLSDLIKFSEGIPQYLSGIFLAVDNKVDIKDNLLELDTEDEEFRSINTDGIILEIRAFDTSYFELYSDSYNLIQQIANQYKSVIREKNL